MSGEAIDVPGEVVDACEARDELAIWCTAGGESGGWVIEDGFERGEAVAHDCPKEAAEVVFLPGDRELEGVKFGRR